MRFRTKGGRYYAQFVCRRPKGCGKKTEQYLLDLGVIYAHFEQRASKAQSKAQQVQRTTLRLVHAS
ncbi:MAG: hypothetical protein U0514_00285 [Candidatus Andersenbacteria bacterium]